MNAAENTTVQTAEKLITAAEKPQVTGEPEEEFKCPEFISVRFEEKLGLGHFKWGDVITGFYDKDYKSKEGDYVIAMDINYALYAGHIDAIKVTSIEGHDCYTRYDISICIDDHADKGIIMREGGNRLRFYRPLYTAMFEDSERLDPECDHFCMSDTY